MFLGKYEHWNSPEVLPPVGCPLVVRLAVYDGQLCENVERTCHLTNRAGQMEYRLPTGETIIGRFAWTYP